MTPRLFSQIVPMVFAAMFWILSLQRIRTLRRLLTEKPNDAQPSGEGIRPLRIGGKTVYLTEIQYRSIMRNTYCLFLIVAMGMLSIIFGSALYRLLHL
jgi:hypothetical protein